MLFRIETYKILRIVAFVVAFGLSQMSAQANILSPNPVTNVADLTAAIERAVANDTIFVRAGTYYLAGTLPWDGSIFTVRAGVSIIGVEGPVLFQQTGTQFNNPRIFTILGSTEPSYITRIENISMVSTVSLGGIRGGVIYAVATAPDSVRLAMDNVSMRGNAERGGAVFANRASITIRNSSIANSNAQHGGAFELTNSTTRIYNSNIAGNGGTAPISTINGGAFLISGGSLEISGSQLFNNSAGGGGQGGGAIHMSGGSTVTLYRVDVANNIVTAGLGGSGFFLADPVPAGQNGNTLNLNFTTVSRNTSDISWAQAGAIRVGPQPNTVNISNSIISGNTNYGYGDDDVPTDNSNINIENSVVGEDYVVSNHPDHECLPVGCDDDVPYGYTRCIYCEVFRPGDIYVYPDGSTRPPPVDVPDVDVGSGGEDAANRASLTLQIYPYPRIICPTDTILFTLNQNNLQGQIQLIRVDSINHIPTDTVGRQIATRGVSNYIANIYLPVPESTIPVLFFRARGQSQGGNNPIVWSNTVHMVVLPQATPRRIDHVSNIPE